VSTATRTPTNRQKVIIEMLANGMDMNEIAAALYISRSGVKREMEALRGQHQLGNPAHVVATAFRKGWIE